MSRDDIDIFDILAAGGALKRDVDASAAIDAKNQAEAASAAAISAASKLVDTGIESGWAFPVTDADGYTAGGILPDGTWRFLKISLPDLAVGLSTLKNEVIGRLLGDSTIGAMLQQWTGGAFSLGDQAGTMTMEVTDSGLIKLYKVLLGPDVTLADAPTTQLKDRLFSAAIGSFFRGLISESGYSLTIEDQDGYAILAIPTSGQLPIKAYVTRAKVADNAIGANGPRENANYLVTTTKDNDGRFQIKSTRKSDGRSFQLTSTGVNIDPWPTSDDYVLYAHSDDEGLTFTNLCVAMTGGSPIPLESTTALDTWGDSLTQGAGGGGTTYPAVLASLIGRTVYNGGIGGQGSRTIAARQGGNPARITVASNQIEASGDTSITSIDTDIFSSGGVAVAGSMAGTLAGIPGTVKRLTTGGPFFFGRTTPGAAVPCPPGTQFIPDRGVLSRPRTQVLWLGRNNFANATQVKSDIAACVAYMTPRMKRYVVMGVLNAISEPRGSANYNAIVALNSDLAAIYGGRFLDIRVPPSADEMTALSYTPTSQDLTDIANDQIPRGMRNDDIHLNAIGYRLVAQRVFNFLQDRSW